MRVRRGLAGAAILAALLASFPFGAASAATPSAHGYWWRLQTGSGPTLPPPAIVPSGGLWAAQDASGQQAVSAVRYRAPSGVQIRRLTLAVWQSSGSGAVLLACPASTTWSPAEAGAWASRPGTSCDVAFVKGVASSDGSSWSFDVRGLARSGTLNVVIMPPPDLSATFSISFQPPGSSSVETERLPGSPSPSTSSSASQSPGARGSGTPPTRVLPESTKRPESQGPLVVPPGSPSSAPTVEAQAPVLPARPRAGWLIAIAAGLALVVLGAGTVFRIRSR
jgi:hypothetical protein